MTALINKSNLQKYMYLKGYNLSNLSNELDIGVSYLSSIVNGKKTPSPKLAKILLTL